MQNLFGDICNALGVYGMCALICELMHMLCVSAMSERSLASEISQEQKLYISEILFSASLLAKVIGFSLTGVIFAFADICCCVR